MLCKSALCCIILAVLLVGCRPQGTRVCALGWDASCVTRPAAVLGGKEAGERYNQCRHPLIGPQDGTYSMTRLTIRLPTCSTLDRRALSFCWTSHCALVRGGL
ncbi:hypothetical protein B0J13DRAFT_43064 [Dactylonectria estremocensis]|uniref:Lipoprotein n=1 Tax=Dactylonectria estremocensis TaxID=1079267 RepID=A0A9P9J790_9HYPO|nr:hypothetical protein B0J13DRAFT_43064 [Dactylonectria estremocensis]